METPPDGYCCGRYASYWNAFLCKICLNQTLKNSEKLTNSVWMEEIVGGHLLTDVMLSAIWDGRQYKKQVAFQSNANHPLAENIGYIKFEGM